jgi:rod shape-determining protein MreC
MKDLLEHKIAIIVIVLTVVFLGFLAFRTGEGARANLGTDGVNILIKPFQVTFTRVTTGVGGFFAHFKDLETERRRSAGLEARLIQAENETREIESYRRENERLRALLDLRDNPRNYEAIAAEVIARDVTNWFSTITIDKGTRDGIEVKQAVITTQGLVGYVTEVGWNWARVNTIINNGTSAGGIVVRTQDVAIVEGTFELQQDRFVRMTYIAADANIVTGDSIETSGLGGIYPRGILIGTITDILPATQTVSQTAIIQPAVDFERISEVLVIK